MYVGYVGKVHDKLGIMLWTSKREKPIEKPRCCLCFSSTWLDSFSVSVSVSDSPNSAWVIAHRAIALLVFDRHASERESLAMRKPTMLSIAHSLPLSCSVSRCAIVDFPFFHFQFQFAWRIHNFPVTLRLHNARRCRSCNTSKFRMQRSLEVELLQGCLQLDRTIRQQQQQQPFHNFYHCVRNTHINNNNIDGVDDRLNRHE